MELLQIPTRGSLAWRGLANVLLGLILVFWPQATVYVVILFFSLNLILVGIFSILEPLFDKKNPHSLSTVALGILSVTFGLYLIIKPQFAAGLIGLIIAFWALLFGIFDLSISFRALKAKIHYGWVMALVGFISVLFGLYMLLSPAEGVLNIVWLFGIYVIAIGTILLLTSLFMTKSKKG